MTTPIDFPIPYATQFLPVIGSEYLEIPASQRTNGSTATALFLPPGVYHIVITWRGNAEITSSMRTVTNWFAGPSIPFLSSGETRSTAPFIMIVPTGQLGRLMLKPSLAMTQFHIDQGWAASVQVIPQELSEAP